jgi:hypothetical protein
MPLASDIVPAAQRGVTAAAAAAVVICARPVLFWALQKGTGVLVCWWHYSVTDIHGFLMLLAIMLRLGIQAAWLQPAHAAVLPDGVHVQFTLQSLHGVRHGAACMRVTYQ